MLKANKDTLEKQVGELKEKTKDLIIEVTHTTFENERLKQQISDYIKLIHDITENYANKTTKQSKEAAERIAALAGDGLSELERLRKTVEIQKTSMDRQELETSDLLEQLRDAIEKMQKGLAQTTPSDHIGEHYVLVLILCIDAEKLELLYGAKMDRLGSMLAIGLPMLAMKQLTQNACLTW